MAKPKSPTAPESVIQKEILGALLNDGYFVWRNNTVGIFDPTTKRRRYNNAFGSKNGVPDILGLLPDGRFLAIEVKSEKGKLSPAQEEFIAEVNKRGGHAFMARSLLETYQGLKAAGYNLTVKTLATQSNTQDIPPLSA